MTQIIQFRRGTASAAASSNPVLAAGEPGFETDTGVLKVGDGTTAWNDLPGIEGGGGGGGGATGADHRVFFFASDFDAAGGSFTNVPTFGFGALNRAYIVGLPFLIVEGDDLGLWVMTASGPCTPGADLVPGDITVALVGGLTGVAASNDASTISGITLSASKAAVDGVVSTAKAEGALRALANLRPGPTRWLECGPAGPGYWSTPTVIPSPTSTMRVRALARSRVTANTSSVDDFHELYSEASDSAGVPGAGGAVDRFELALAADSEGRSWLFWEHLEVGAARENSYDDAGDGFYRNGRGAPLPPGVWVEVEILVEFTAGRITWRVRSDFSWDHTDGSDGTTWITTRVRELGAATTLEASDGLEQWIGRNGGAFDVARVRRWDDGDLVMDADPSSAAGGDDTFEDAVLESAPGVAAVWTSAGTNTVTTP